MSKKRELLARAYIILGGIFLMALILIGGTARISVFEADKWQAKGDSTKLKFVDIAPDRGNIYSADGYLLATSVPFFDVHMDLNSEAMTDRIFNEHVDSLAIYLSRHIFKKESVSSLERRLVREREAGNRYFLIEKNVTFDRLEQIRKFPLIREGKYQGGLLVERKSKRLKPFKNLASRTIGLDRLNAQSVGIEGAFDSYLRGNAGKKLMQRLANGLWIPVHDLSEIQPERGMDITTTLDMRTQDICQTALLRGLLNHDADFGVAIVMEVKTGAVKAIANLNRQQGGNYWESFNHAIGDATEPGSTFKLASVMALLEDGYISVEDSVNINHGRAYFGSNEMRDSEWHSETNVTIRRAFEISSNVGIAKVVDKMYGRSNKGQQYVDRLVQFGLRDKTGIEIEGEGTPEIRDANHSKWSKVMSLPWMAHGYELEITPLQTLAFYNAVANDGKKMKPFLVKNVLDGGRVIKTFEPQVQIKQIASAATIREAQGLLEGVVLQGTGSALRSKDFTFAGKTGTTKLEYWKEGSDKYQSSFVGYFPAEEPLYSCIVLINNPRKNGYYGGTVAGPVFREIAEKCMATDEQLMAKASIPLTEEENPSLPSYEVGYASDMIEVLKHLNIDFSKEVEGAWSITLPGEGEVAVRDRTIDSHLVPNVVGMGLRDAVFILENRGMTVKINGHGRVKEQSIKPGSKLQGQSIMLFLG